MSWHWGKKKKPKPLTIRLVRETRKLLVAESYEDPRLRLWREPWGCHDGEKKATQKLSTLWGPFMFLFSTYKNYRVIGVSVYS